MSLEGTELKGRYVIKRQLGLGGLGIVYLADDIQLSSRPVVIKTLRGDVINPSDPWFIEKFEKEIQALIKVRHPGVIGVLDAGEMPDGQPFFVMQYVEGSTLRRALYGGMMELNRIARIVRQISYALSAAHDQGVIHRDLKPENVMLQVFPSGEEVVYLIDFGIASIIDPRATQPNQATRVAGTPPYMAPEQLRGESTMRSDIWSLGVVAYEAVTGKLPFPTHNVLELANLQQNGVAILPKALRASLPTEAQRVILQALAFDPADRYEGAHIMGDAFLDAMLRTEVDPDLKPKSPRTMASPETPEDGHVLFMDVVGFSKLPMTAQRSLMQKLTKIVGEASEFKKADANEQLIRLSTGDGMALVFFQNPMAAVQCALEITTTLKRYPDIALRMGLHSGPVFRVVDINNNPNVTGSGINLAQRVMDSGDVGHILLSKTVADNLVQMGQWQDYLQDLGEHEVKHGLLMHFYSLFKGDLGSGEWPSRLKRRAPPLALSTLGDLLTRCRELFETLHEFDSPRGLRALLRLHGLTVYEKRCVPKSEVLDLDQLIDCLRHAGREYEGHALVELLNLLVSQYQDDHKRTQYEELGNQLKALLDPQHPTG
jgi:serine/threonine protein kinase